MKRSWKSRLSEIISLYQSGQSPFDISKRYDCSRETIKNLISNSCGLRSQSESAKLAVKNGKKDKAINALIRVARTTNRNNPLKYRWKGNPELHPNWKKDRTILKRKRGMTEEKVFFKELIIEGGFKCQLTGLTATLSVHHIKGVWKYPELTFDKSNCVVILKKIHDKFHTMYGKRTDSEQWLEFVKNKEYEEFVGIVKKPHTPFKDLVGQRFGRLTVLKWENGKWTCLCDCGNITTPATTNLIVKKTTSCGCFQREFQSKRMKENPIWIKGSAAKKGTKTNKICHLKREAVEKQLALTFLN